MFVYNKIEPLDVKVQEVFGRRFYITPQGNRYPSITTVLGAKDKPWLNDWRESLGEDRANKEMRRAVARGTAVHTMIEKYLLNEDNPQKGHSIEHVGEFNSIRTRLNPINNIRAMEVPLYSDTLKVAGRVDCIADYDGVLSVVDFKTSTNFKSQDMIEDYFLQATGYAIMFNELYDQWIDDIVILMSVERGDGIPLLFREKVDNFIKPLIQRINMFNKEQK